MAGESATSATQSSQIGTATIGSSSSISSRNFVDSHLESTRPADSVAKSSTTTTTTASLTTNKEQKDAMLEQAMRQQEAARLKQDQLKEFAKQEKETTTKVAEVKSLINGSRERVAALEASYREYKDSWNFFRALTSEKETILQGLAREKELLKAHETRLKEFELRQEDFKKTKAEFLALEEKSMSSSGGRENYQARDRILSRLRAQSASLDNLVALDIIAFKKYQYSQEHDHPRNAWEQMKDAAYESFKESKAGRFLIGAATVVSKVYNAVSDAVVGTVKFFADPKTWEKAWEGIKWGASKTWDGIKWVGSKIADGAEAAWDGVKKAGTFLVNKAIDYIKHPEKILIDIVNGIATVASAVGKGLSAVGNALYKVGEIIVKKGIDYLLHPEKLLTDIVDGVCAIGSAIGRGCCALGRGICALGRGIATVAKGLYHAAETIVSTAIDFIRHPSKLLNALKDGCIFVLGALKDTALLVGQFLVDPNAAWDKLCKNVDKFMTKLTDAIGMRFMWEGAKHVLGFIKELGDSLGITSIIAGAANILTMPTRLLYQGCKAAYSTAKLLYNYTMGNINDEALSNGLSDVARAYKENIKEGLTQCARLGTGVFRLTMECTGLADIGRGIIAAMKGNWTEAGMYFGLGAANLIALGCAVLTAGAGAGLYAGITAMRKSMQAAAVKLGQECLEVVGKGLGRVIGEEFVSKVGMKALNREAIAVADNLVEMCAQKGLSLDTIEEMAKSLTKGHFKEFLEKNGLGDLVESRVKKTLQTIIDHPNPKSLTKAFSEMPELAQLSKKQIKAAREMLISGKNFDDVTKVLTKEITDSIHSKIGPELEETFAKRFRASLAGEVDTPAAKKLAAQVEKEAAEKGIPKGELIEEYVTRARKGFREGLREAIEEVVEAAIKRALRSLKYPKESGSHMAIQNEEHERKALEKQQQKLLAQLEKKLNAIEIKEKGEGIAKKADLDHGHIKLTRTERVVIDGKTYMALFEQLDNGQWRNSGMTLVDEIKKSVEKTAKAEEAIADGKIIPFAKPKSDKAAA